MQSHILGPCSCLNFPAISRLSLKQSLVFHLGKDKAAQSDVLLLVGTDSGHHTTLRAVRIWQDGALMATLDIDQTEPNISWDPELGSYFVRVEREELLADDQAHQSYLMIYRLHVDNATMAFVPTFGGRVMKFYLDRYKQEHALAEAIGPQIAALVSTGNHNIICDELGELARAGTPKTEIAKALKEVAAAGFPAFDASSCRGN
jgi:hypothetical protein